MRAATARFVAIVAVLLGTLGAAGAVGVPSAAAATSCPLGQYQAEYFNNRTFSGTPALRRCEASINNSWGGGGPGSGVNVDNFSARWTGRHSFAAGSHTFTARADDGIRVWLDGAQIIDGWKDQGATTYTATRALTAGEHEVKVEYYENGGDAVAQLRWQADTAPVPGALDAEESAFLTLINDYRARNGLRPLTASPTLTDAAAWLSADMAAKNYFSHTDSLGRDPFVRMCAFGYCNGTRGENIAAGNATAQATFTQWVNSPPHNANMLNPDYTVIGVGRAPGGTYGWYWTTDFGSAPQ